MAECAGICAKLQYRSSVMSVFYRFFTLPCMIWTCVCFILAQNHRLLFGASLRCQIGTVLIYDSLLSIAYRPLLQVWAAPNLHVAAINVFPELLFVYTGATVTQLLRKSILSQSYWDCMFSATLLRHILRGDLLCTFKGKKHKIYQKLSESLWSWWYYNPYAGQIIKLFPRNSFIYPCHTTAM